MIGSNDPSIKARLSASCMKPFTTLNPLRKAFSHDSPRPLWRIAFFATWFAVRKLISSARLLSIQHCRTARNAFTSRATSLLDKLGYDLLSISRSNFAEGAGANTPTQRLTIEVSSCEVTLPLPLSPSTPLLAVRKNVVPSKIESFSAVVGCVR